MFYCNRLPAFFLLVLIACIGLVSCAEKKEGKVIVTEQEFSIRQDAEYNWVIDAKGKIRNVGEVDVKKVVVTGYCRSCSEIWTAGRWLRNDGVEKFPEQKDVINYLTTGTEEEFSFKEVAFYFRPGGPGPEGKMPENLEVVVESFETVDG
jgi:NMD protein affecting ribosome stability and mRNA decay